MYTHLLTYIHSGHSICDEGAHTNCNLKETQEKANTDPWLIQHCDSQLLNGQSETAAKI